MARKLKEYSPTEYLDFSKPRIRKEQEEALAKVRRKFGKEYPLVVGGKKVMTSYVVPSVNPANPKEIVGRFAHASGECDLCRHEGQAGDPPTFRARASDFRSGRSGLR